MRAAGWVLLLAACSPDRLQSSAGGLAFDPTSAVVPGQLTLRSTLPKAADVTLSVPAPFAVSPSALTLIAQGSAVVTVTIDAAQGGHFVGRLDARAGSTSASAALTADVACLPPPVCQKAEVKDGRCVVMPVTDGTACTDPCLENAACSSGACAGAAKQCADADPCTVDACEKGAGCVHLKCEELEDPCRAGTCTASGCAFDPLPDGTQCGASDCVDAHVCVAGACSVRPVPEGAACETPCGSGTCTSSECALTPGTVMHAAWTMSVGPAFNVASPLAADAAGNVYWLEEGSMSDRLVSVTSIGTPRWAVSLGREKRAFSSREVMVDDAHGLVVYSEAGGQLEARKLADGAHAWTRTIVNDLMTAPDVAAGDTGYLGTVAGGSVLVVDAFLYAAAGGSPKRQVLYGLDAATGKTLWSTLLAPWAGVVLDEASNVYQRIPSMGGWSILSHSPAGTVRWANAPSSTTSEVKAVFDGRVYLAHGEGLVAATGAAAFPAPLVPDDENTFGSLQYLEGEWLAGKGVAYLALGQYAAPRGVDPQSGALKWIRKSSSYRPTDALLTSTGTRLLLDQRHLGPAVGWRWHVSALTPGGREAWACMLPDYGWYDLEGVSLVGQRLVVTGRAVNPVPQPYPLHTGVAAFALPGFTIARGWSVTSAGSLARSHRPQ